MLNDNLDTGTVTGAATYRLADEAYAKLLDKTSGKPVLDALRLDLLSYYADLEKPFATKRNSKAWHDLIKELDTLKSTPVVDISIPTERPAPPPSSLLQELQCGPTMTDGEEIDFEPIDGRLSCTSRSMYCQSF